MHWTGRGLVAAVRLGGMRAGFAGIVCGVLQDAADARLPAAEAWARVLASVPHGGVSEARLETVLALVR